MPSRIALAHCNNSTNDDSYLGESEPQLLGQTGPVSPFTPTELRTRLAVPVSGATHDLTDSPYLIHFVAAGEQRLERRDLDGHSTNCPHVDWGGVLSGPQKDFRGAIPAGRDVGCVGHFRVGFACKTKVGDLNGVGGRSGGRGNEVGVATEGRVIGGGCGYQDVLWLDIAVEEMMGMNVVQTAHNLVEDALDVLGVERLVVSCLHQLVEVAVHVFHADVELSGKGVEEDVQGGDEMRVNGQCAEEDDFS